MKKYCCFEGVGCPVNARGLQAAQPASKPVVVQVTTGSLGRGGTIHIHALGVIKTSLNYEYSIDTHLCDGERCRRRKGNSKTPVKGKGAIGRPPTATNASFSSSQILGHAYADFRKMLKTDLWIFLSPGSRASRRRIERLHRRLC